MKFRFPRTIRMILAGFGVVIMGAGQFPAAPLAAVRFAAVPTPAITLDIPTDGVAVASDVLTSDAAYVRPARLATLIARVSEIVQPVDGNRDCLARAVYFEARGEPLEGQLAVAQVILNRVTSKRFASSACGVIAQHGQFSFDRSRAPADGRDWRTAKAIALIAETAAWDSMAPQATAFHATRVAASWTTMRKVGTIGNHVFYR